MRLPPHVRRQLGLEPERPAPRYVMNFEDWRAAVALAHAKLCQGDGFGVRVGEAWVSALIRVAGTLLDDKGFGRAHGKAGECTDEMANFVTDVARRPSTSADGCIAMESGIRVRLTTYPRGVDLAS